MHNQKPQMASNVNTLNAAPLGALAAPAIDPVRRITSEFLMQDRREVEIEHSGKIYRLRVTQLNKLILTA